MEGAKNCGETSLLAPPPYAPVFCLAFSTDGSAKRRERRQSTWLNIDQFAMAQTWARLG